MRCPGQLLLQREGRGAGALHTAQAAVGRRSTSGGDHPGVALLLQGAQWAGGRTQAPQGCGGCTRQAWSSSAPGGQAEATNSKQTNAPIELLNAVRHHQGLAHQERAWQLLQRSLTPEQLRAFGQAFRSAAPPARKNANGLIQLPVLYLSQNDSVTGQGSRMCFASTCAMAATYLKPGCLRCTGQLDDHYLTLVQRHGDTTDVHAQVSALQSLGLHAHFRMDGCIEHLIAQLKQGIPCPVGWLHKGSVSAPRGGGHWSLVIDWDPETRQLRMHDLNGESDLVNGGYLSHAVNSGQNLRYSERNWCRRWQVEGAATGWWLQLTQVL